MEELNKWISILSQYGRLREVEPLLLQTSRLAHREYGENHPAHVSILNDLGGLYRSTGEYSKPEPSFLKAMQFLGNTLGKDHSGYATCINNLAGLYRLTGDYPRADQLFLEASDIYAHPLLFLNQSKCLRGKLTKSK